MWVLLSVSSLGVAGSKRRSYKRRVYKRREEVIREEKRLKREKKL